MSRENLSSEVCDQLKLTRACSVLEDSLSLEIVGIVSKVFILYTSI